VFSALPPVVAATALEASHESPATSSSGCGKSASARDGTFLTAPSACATDRTTRSSTMMSLQSSGLWRFVCSSVLSLIDQPTRGASPDLFKIAHREVFAALTARIIRATVVAEQGKEAVECEAIDETCQQDVRIAS
jgi:hypothetical protein